MLFLFLITESFPKSIFLLLKFGVMASFLFIYSLNQ